MTTAGAFDLPSPLDDAAAFAPFLPLAEVVVPPFPLDALPTWLGDFVGAVAEATQTPADLAGLLGLGAVSTAVAKRVRVKVREGYSEPVNIFAAVALPPASRKTQVFADCASPLVECQREAAEIALPIVARALEANDQMRERIKYLRMKAKKGDDPEAEREGRDLAETLAAQEAAAPSLPRLTTDDCTPESLAGLLHRNGGRMAVWSPEGGEVFEMIGGRYAGNARPNLGVYLQGHAGDPLNVDRRHGGHIYVERPALTVVLAVQPSVIRALRDSSTFRERGLLARFIYSLPPSTVGRRDCEPRPVLPAIARTYRDSLRALLDRPASEATLMLDPGAYEAWLAFARDLEPRLAEDADLGPIADWAGKLQGLVARLAGLLHAAEWADKADPFAEPVDRTTMARALDLGRYALGHAQAAFALMAFDPHEAGAGKVWRYIARRSLAEVTHQDLWQATKGGRIEGADDLEAALGLLVSRGYLRASGRNGAGPRAFRVNPEALEHAGVRGNRGTHA